MKTVYDALDPIVNGSATTKEKGDKFERTPNVLERAWIRIPLSTGGSA